MGREGFSGSGRMKALRPQVVSGQGPRTRVGALVYVLRFIPEAPNCPRGLLPRHALRLCVISLSSVRNLRHTLRGHSGRSLYKGFSSRGFPWLRKFRKVPVTGNGVIRVRNVSLPPLRHGSRDLPFPVMRLSVRVSDGSNIWFARRLKDRYNKRPVGLKTAKKLEFIYRSFNDL